MKNTEGYKIIVLETVLKPINTISHCFSAPEHSGEKSVQRRFFIERSQMFESLTIQTFDFALKEFF